MSALARELIGAVLAAIREDATVRDQFRDALGMEATEDRWMTVAEAARYLRVSEKTVRRQMEDGRLPYEQDGPGARIYLRRSALDASRDSGSDQPLRFHIAS